MPQSVNIKRNCVTYVPQILKHECLHHIFEATVDRFPHRPAVICDQDSMTYKTLDARSNQLANYLRKHGVIRGSRVAILLDRSFEQYIAILAIIKAGAAYIPLDPGYPADRISYILEDCDIKTMVTLQSVTSIDALSCSLIEIDHEAAAIACESTSRLSPTEVGLRPTDLSYVIYTSGSTGRPKGVMIEHRNVCHLVRASQMIYQVRPEDRVYQGFTIAFDASVEEIWMAFASGGALVVSTATFTQAGNQLPQLLTKAGITVLSCVPTLLTMWNEDLPTLRILILGGEECPNYLVERWAKPGRKMFNTYGPTEATVIATYAECSPDRSVTIGKPLPNYEVYVLDEQMNELPHGEPGELHIGGPGLARGYVNREELTKNRFVTSAFADRLYKTGDLVRYDAEGNLEFLGRIDRQVKLRGYRVELSEIEELLLQTNEIQQVAVHVHEQSPGLQVLAAYIVAKQGEKIDRAALYNRLKERLPSYMVPTYMMELYALPVLLSGKIDYKSLPLPSENSAFSTENYVAPASPMEKEIASVWESILKRSNISVESDFFRDLGGHSLFAALVVSKLRQRPAMLNLAISQLYQHPTIRELARFVELRESRQEQREQTPDSQRKVIQPVSTTSYSLTGFVQAIAIYFRYLFIILPLLLPYFYVTESLGNWTWYTLLIGVSVGMTIYIPTALLLSVLMKWLFIGRYRAGIYSLWGSYYLRWWLVRQFQSLVPLTLMTGTPLINWYYRLMGAKIGNDVYIGTEMVHSFDLIRIGDHASVGLSAQLLGYTIRDGNLVIGSIKIGAHAYVGSNAVLSSDVIMEDHTQLGEQSMLTESTTIPTEERWVGSPAQLSKTVDPELCQLTKHSTKPTSTFVKWLMMLGFLLALIVLVVIPLISIIPGTITVYLLFPHLGHWQLLALPLCAAMFTISLFLQIFLIKSLLLRKVQEGNYPLQSSFYLRKWLVDKLLLLSLYLNNSIYATIYTAPFLRLLGAKIGKRVEVSTVHHISPELLYIDSESFIADAACIGTPKIYSNQMSISKTKIGYRTFIGNSAYVDGGKEIGNHTLLGVMSVPPENEQLADRTSWLGTPAIYLPRREINNRFTETETYQPTKRLLWARYIIEFCRVTFPGTFLITMIWLWLVTITITKHYLSTTVIILLVPIINITLSLLATLLIVLLKQALIGRYRKDEKPLWSTFVWRSELITALYENVTVPTLVHHLLGTPFAQYVLQLFGVKIGKRVYLESTYLSEFDLVTIEDHAMINANTTLQTHLFEDRVMKMSHLTIGKHCTVGNSSIVLYDTTMHEYSTLSNLSLLMKGESLPAHTDWEGAPAQLRDKRRSRSSARIIG